MGMVGLVVTLLVLPLAEAGLVVPLPVAGLLVPLQMVPLPVAGLVVPLPVVGLVVHLRVKALRVVPHQLVQLGVDALILLFWEEGEVACLSREVMRSAMLVAG